MPAFFHLPKASWIVAACSDLAFRYLTSKHASQLLQPALFKAPHNAEIQYHYAHALTKSGDTAVTRSKLIRLFVMGAAFHPAQTARFCPDNCRSSHN